DAFVWKKEHKIYRNPLPDARNLMEIFARNFGKTYRNLYLGDQCWKSFAIYFGK
ncbi:hypothetical protein BgiBS90_012925, partial [Biomphalaria glabrata]